MTMQIIPNYLHFFPQKGPDIMQKSDGYIKIPLKNIINVTKVVTIHCYDLAPDYSFKGETHDFWEFYYVDRGEYDYRFGEETYHATKGDIIFIPPNVFHNVVCDGTHSVSLFIVTFDCVSSAIKQLTDYKGKLPRELSQLMKRLIEESTHNFEVSYYPLKPLDKPPLGGLQLIRMYIEELLIGLLRHQSGKREAVTPKVVRETDENSLVGSIRQFLEDRVCDRLSSRDIVARFHFGKSYIYDLFKRTYGKSIMSYHSELKIEEAKRLLREEPLTVREISERLCFESPEYFSRAFKRKVGMSPRAFRGMLMSSSVKIENKVK